MRLLGYTSMVNFKIFQAIKCFFYGFTLLQTCRQIREEGLKVFYEKNTFRFDCHVFAPLLLETGATNVERMRRVEIHTGLSPRGTQWGHELNIVISLDVRRGLRKLSCAHLWRLLSLLLNLSWPDLPRRFLRTDL